MWEKLLDWKASNFDSYSPRKRRHICHIICIFEKQDYDKILQFPSKFWIETITVCQILNSNFKPVTFCIKAFRTCHTLNWFFLRKSGLEKFYGENKTTFWFIFACRIDNFCFLFAILKGTTLTAIFQKSFRIAVFENFNFQRIRLSKGNFFKNSDFEMKNFHNTWNSVSDF